MIPKKIHFCWLSNDAYPDLVKHCQDSWANILPDYEVVIWDKDKIDINKHPWPKQAFEKGKYAFAADFIRLYSIYTEGGIYLDSDVEVVKSFDEFLELKSFIGMESSGDLEPAIIGAEPGCDWVGKCLEYYQGRNFILPTGDLDMTPLPIVLAKCLESDHSISSLSRVRINILANGLHIYPSSYFSPKSLYSKSFKIRDNTVCIHHFDGSWINRGFKYYLKFYLHKALIKFLGSKSHYRIVKMLRNI